MILFWVALSILVLVVGYVYFTITTDRKLTKQMCICIGILMLVALWMLSTAAGAAIGSSAANAENLKTYDSLLLYHDVVSNSKDELLRWDYYQRVQEWNEAYVNWVYARNNPWISCFHGAQDYANCGPIEFVLNRG